MRHPWIIPSLTYLIPLAILGLALGVFFRYLGFGHADFIVVEPPITEIAVDPLQYQAITVHLQLTNRTGKKIQVQKADTSCGCASLVTRGGVKLVEPLDVPSRGTVPWQVVIHTGGLSGPHEFKVYFEIQSGGRINHAVSTIKMNIRPGIAIIPQEMDFGGVAPNDERTAEFVLSDAYPDSGYSVAHIQVSDPQRLQVKLTAPEKDAPTGLVDTENAYANFRARWYIQLRYKAPASPRALVQDEIVLEPTNKLYPQISIPITCRMTPPAYEISPEALVFTAESLGQTIHRTVRCRVHAGADPALQVRSAPGAAKVKVIPLDTQTVELRVTLKMPQQTANVPTIEPIVIGTNASASNAFSIPIEFVGLN